MKQLGLCSSLYKFNSAKEFIDDFSPCKDDLMITCEYIFKPFFSSFDIQSQIIFQEKFGAGEPSDEMIEKMLAAVNPGYKRVIAIGGGTVMDIAKLFALKQITPLEDLFTGKIPPEKKCPLVLIPTTCGTGSEVTNVSVVKFSSLGTKLRLVSDSLYADDAVLIPELLKNLPRPVFAASSIDALITSAEACLSPLATPYSELFGHEAIKMILNGYKQISEHGFSSLDGLLENFLIASDYSGISFALAGCGAVHAMSYPLSGKYRVIHGEAVYALFTDVLRMYSKKQCSDKYDTVLQLFSNALGCKKSDVFDSLDALIQNIFPKKPLSAYGVTEQDIPEFTDDILARYRSVMSHNPTVLDRQDVIAVYKACL